VFHVTRSPMSLPNFVNDVAEAFGEFVNAESEAYAAGRAARYPLVAAGGGKEALLAQMKEFDAGSDHTVYTDSSFKIPAIYLNDWPDRYIHTNLDLPSNIDPTKLGRAAFIAGVSGYVLARITNADVPALNEMLDAFALERRAAAMRRKEPNVVKFAEWYEREAKASIARFVEQSLLSAPDRTEKSVCSTCYRRNPKVKGPMSAFGYDYFDAHYKGAPIKLNGEYRYEALNLVNGQRTAQEIRDALSAIYAPVALEDVVQYLEALASIGVILPSDSAPSASRSRSSP